VFAAEFQSGISAQEFIQMKEQRSLKTAARLANLVFVGTALVCLLVLSYFIYYYTWTGQRQFSSWKGVLLYYLLPALLAAASLGCLRLPAFYRINTALLLFSGGALLAFTETMLAVWFNLPSANQDPLIEARREAAEELGTNFDTRSKMEVVDDLRREGHDAVPALFPQGFFATQEDGTQKSILSFNGAESLPLAGISNRLTVVCNESGQYVNYQSDEHGFNNPSRVWELPLIDVAAVGDSYVHIWCVPLEKHFVTLIRNRYPATLNLGIEGNGPLTMLATIKEYAEVVRPKVVLWFFYEGNDLVDFETERTAPMLMRYLNGGFSQGLYERQADIDSALTNLVETSRTTDTKFQIKLREIIDLVRDKERVLQLLRSITRVEQLRQRLGLIAGRNGSVAGTGQGEFARSGAATMELFERVLVEAKNTVNGWDGKLYFIYLPSRNRYVPGQQGYPDRDLVLQLAHRLGLPVIDIHQNFLTVHDPLNLFHFRLPSHYTEEGNRIVAEQVLKSISVKD
jgi:hypothetical protein